ncbi:MAG: hybrid sensor histidine kinase/response regulator [Methylophilus sp.]|uniref:PAS domain-containing hybrid sensor histidine kinase/response regulator n=1 Tax=Methylophilus sp. TaxID=29541 RepID=UPI003FA057B7
MPTTSSEATPFKPDHPEMHFRAIAEYAPVMMWISGKETLFGWFNKQWRDFTGCEFAQAGDSGWAESVHAEDIERCRDIYTQALDAQQAFTIEYRLKCHDGTFHWVADNGVPTYSEQGVFIGFVGSCVIIQERKDLEARLAQETAALQQLQQQKNAISSKSETLTQLYETILSATPDLIYNFDFSVPEPRFSYVNAGLVQMLGRPFDEIVGKTLRELGYEDWHAEMHHKEIDIVRTTKKPIRGEVAFTGTFGRRIYDYIFAPVFGSNGEVVAVAGTTRDVTESHDAQEMLKKNKEALQEADLKKDEFLAMLAHELRNPLAPISAATQIMVLSNYEESRVRKSSQIIERQVKHMVGLVDDLLDVSRVTRGLVNIEKLPQDMAAVIASSLEQVRPLIESRQHALIVDLTPLPAKVLGDHKRLVQVVSNILNNSAKYIENSGQIKLAMKVEHGAVIITVADNGIGVLREEQESIFELFAQAKRSSDRSQGGLGIGLALVKSMLKLHDGTISCFSEGLDKGSVFTITLPLWTEQVAAENNTDSVEQQQQKMSVLVVDDNVDAATTLASFIELYGHEVLVEHDSLKALALIESVLPAVCVLDIGLPKMDGYELARRIKANAAMADATLIAVTGYGREDDKKMALQSGFDYHLVKPVDFEQLMKLINDAADKAAA